MSAPARTSAMRVGIAVAALLAISIVLAIAGTGESPGAVPEPLVAGANAAGVDAGAGAASADTSANPMAVVADDAEDGDAGPAASDDPATGDPATGDDPTPGDDPTTADGTVSVLVLWWNDTQDAPITGARVSIGAASWQPDLAADSARGTLVSVPVGEDIALVIEIDGEDGTHVEVPIRIEAGMTPGVERDAITVEVSDGSVRVLGNPVNNIDVSLDRL